MEKVGIAVWRERRLLTVRKQGHSLYILPGGKPEPSDRGDTDTLRRELREELGCGVNTETLHWVGVFRDRSADDPDEEISVRLFEGDLDGRPRPAAEIVECRWFDPDRDDPGQLAPSIRNSILPHFRRAPGANDAAGL
jgi:8-oxo-dGTP diphosphatase